MSNFWQRAITGTLFVMALIAAIVWNAYSTFALFLVFSVIGLKEFYTITKTRKTQIAFSLALTLGALVYVLVSAVRVFNMSTYLLALSFPIAGLFLVIELFRQQKRPITNIAYSVFGILYIMVPFALLNYIPAINFGFEGDQGRLLLLAFFVSLWSNDTGAYLVGRAFGRTKLFERISPNKTWEGFFGGVALSMVAAYCFSLLLPQLSTISWLIFGALISTFGTLGDLVESMLKRNYQIKDSGTILPGHGGVLDRFDGIFLACPIVFMYLEFLSQLSL